jgi:hypothetical protein
LAVIGNLLSCGVTSQEISCVKSGLSSMFKKRERRKYAKFFSQTTHPYNKEGTPMGLLLGGGGLFRGTLVGHLHSNNHKY